MIGIWCWLAGQQRQHQTPVLISLTAQAIVQDGLWVQLGSIARMFHLLWG
jgi:hypothetical protein